MHRECQLCGGPLALLGALGRLLHFRCVNCGVECSIDQKEID